MSKLKLSRLYLTDTQHGELQTTEHGTFDVKLEAYHDTQYFEGRWHYLIAVTGVVTINRIDYKLRFEVSRYNHIHQGELSIRTISLRRLVGLEKVRDWRDRYLPTDGAADQARALAVEVAALVNRPEWAEALVAGFYAGHAEELADERTRAEVAVRKAAEELAKVEAAAEAAKLAWRRAECVASAWLPEHAAQRDVMLQLIDGWAGGTADDLLAAVAGILYTADEHAAAAA